MEDVRQWGRRLSKKSVILGAGIFPLKFKKILALGEKLE